jgi:uncharacterized protein
MLKISHRFIGLPAVALIAAALLVGVAAPFGTVHAQDGSPAQPHTITVSGSGTASGTPDIAFVQVGVEIHNADVGTAVQQANDAMQKVNAALTAEGIAAQDIQTTQFNVRQDQQPAQNGQPAATTFVVTNIVQVKVHDLTTISTVIQSALDAGANNVYGLNFGLNDSAALESQARSAAVDNAHAKAQELADAFGVTLGAPISISEQSGGNPPVAASFAMANGGGGPSISQGQLSVTVQLNVTYSIAQ